MNSKNLNFGEIVHFYMGRTEEVYMYPELNPVWDSNYLQLIDKKPTPMGPMGDKRMIYTFMPLKRGETIIYNATWRQDIHHSDPPYRNIVINLWGAIR
ncbi:MAG: hypothetical protein ACXVHV_06270 [Methanobacterium sp.]